MSYCRFSEGDVYAYACEGGVQFWVAGKNLDRLCNTYDSAYQYAKYLCDECGLDVPSHAIDALRADALDELNHGDESAVAELVSENAKLRELVRDMFEEIEAGGFDPMVERHGKSTVYYEEDPSWRVGIRERMRELGIEVDA